MARPSMMPPPPDPRALLAAGGLHAKKSWGQNFLLDQRVLADIAALAEAAPGRTIIELGAGLGALTYHLLARGAAVVAVERDRDIVPLLRQALAWAEGLRVLEADAATLDYADLAVTLGPLTVTGNLPYQLSSRIIVGLADGGPAIGRAVLMVQREVAERMSAGAGEPEYGLLSVLVQRRFAVRLARVVPPGSFLPRPKVDSAVVVLQAKADARDAHLERAMVAAARAAFHSRRKTLKNSLCLALRGDAGAVEAAIVAAALDPKARAETIDLDGFARLGAALAERSLLGGVS